MLIKAASLLKNSEGLLSIIVAKTPKQKDQQQQQQQQGHQLSHSPVPTSTLESPSPISSKILTEPLTSHHRKYSSTIQAPLGNSNNNNNNDNSTLNKNQIQLDQESTLTPLELATIASNSGPSKQEGIILPSDTSYQFVTIHPGDPRNVSPGIPSSICDPKTCAIVPGRENVIEITKVTNNKHNPLGLSIAGGIDTPLVSKLHWT